jgi:hypothetical protein
VIELDATPGKVTITDGWEFSHFNGCESVNGKVNYTLSLFNINGGR